VRKKLYGDEYEERELLVEAPRGSCHVCGSDALAASGHTVG
jgi:hypothetical protein